MTVQELIRELQAIPNQHAQVKVVLSSVWIGLSNEIEPLSDIDALEADEVRNMGAFVLVRSK